MGGTEEAAVHSGRGNRSITNVHIAMEPGRHHFTLFLAILVLVRLVHKPEICLCLLGIMAFVLNHWGNYYLQPSCIDVLRVIFTCGDVKESL